MPAGISGIHRRHAQRVACNVGFRREGKSFACRLVRYSQPRAQRLILCKVYKGTVIFTWPPRKGVFIPSDLLWGSHYFSYCSSGLSSYPRKDMLPA
jgi:hypothetical protein